MAAFQQGTIHIKKKSSVPNADAGWIRVYVGSDGNVYNVDENGNAARLVESWEVADISGALQTQINGKQAADDTLTALAGFNTNGIVTQTASNTFVGRTVTGSSSVNVTNGNGVGGNPTIDVTDYISGTTVASISGELQSQISSINVVGGSNVTVVESPANTFTVSTTGGGGVSDIWLTTAASRFFT